MTSSTAALSPHNSPLAIGRKLSNPAAVPFSYALSPNLEPPLPTVLQHDVHAWQAAELEVMRSWQACLDVPRKSFHELKGILQPPPPALARTCAALRMMLDDGDRWPGSSGSPGEKPWRPGRSSSRSPSRSGSPHQQKHSPSRSPDRDTHENRSRSSPSLRAGTEQTEVFGGAETAQIWQFLDKHIQDLIWTRVIWPGVAQKKVNFIQGLLGEKMVSSPNAGSRKSSPRKSSPNGSRKSSPRRRSPVGEQKVEGEELLWTAARALRESVAGAAVRRWIVAVVKLQQLANREGVVLGAGELADRRIPHRKTSPKIWWRTVFQAEAELTGGVVDWREKLRREKLQQNETIAVGIDDVEKKDRIISGTAQRQPS